MTFTQAKQRESGREILEGAFRNSKSLREIPAITLPASA